MRQATRIVAASIGVVAGIAGLEHGLFEILQGNAPPAGLMFASMGPPCLPSQTWDACEPAMTVLPNLLVTGLLGVLLSLLMIAWSAAWVQRPVGAAGLVGLSVGLLLLGGGFFPPMFGLVAAAVAAQINRPLPTSAAGPAARLAARLWPWPLVILIVWGLGQFLIGYFFNDFLQSAMVVVLPLFVAMLPLSAYSGDAYDRCRRASLPPPARTEPAA